MNAWLVAVLVCLLTAGCASEKPKMYHEHALPDPEGYNAHFGDMDTNGDERVSWDEFKAYFPQTEPKVFATLDMNKDGVVDHDEWHAFKEAHGLEHQ